MIILLINKLIKMIIITKNKLIKVIILLINNQKNVRVKNKWKILMINKLIIINNNNNKYKYQNLYQNCKIEFK